MAKVVVSMIMSLDGYHEGAGQDVLALPFDDGFSAYNLERLRAAGTLLSGRRGYEGFRAYWPPVADDPDQPETEREISRINGRLEKVVVSDTLTPDPEAPWAATTRIVSRADAAAVVADLRAADDGDVLIFGSPTMWNPLLDAGLIDEVHLMVGPKLLGAGTTTYAGSGRALRLLEARVLEDSQLVLLRYDAQV